MRWIVAAALLLAGAARAEVVLVGAAGRPAEAVLIGGDGAVYARDGAVWRRRAAGGTAAALVSAWGASPADVWAMGAAAPPYHWNGETWNAVPVGHGGAAVLAGSGSTPALAAGRRILVRLREGAGWRWQEIVAPGAPRWLWAAGAADVVAVSQDGRLWRDAGGWKQITGPADVTNVAAGRVAVARDGSVWLVGRARASRVPAPADFRARLAAVAGSRVFVLGEGYLAAIKGNNLVLLEAAPAGDAPVALLAGEDGSVLVVGRGGTVLRRAAAGGWSVEHVDGSPAPAAAHVELPPARVGR